MEDGGKKPNLNLFLEKIIGKISGKVNEGEERKKTLDLLKNPYFFYLLKLTGFFLEIGKNPMRALGRKSG